MSSTSAIGDSGHDHDHSHHHVHGYDEFCRFVDNLPTTQQHNEAEATASGDCGGAAERPPLYILFCGSKDAATGVNWCPYCTTAEPVVAEGLKLAPAGSTLLHVTVGERD